MIDRFDILNQRIDKIDQSVDKLSEQVQSLSIGQGRISTEIAELRRSIVCVATLPKDVALNKQSIDGLRTEQQNAKKLLWKLIIGVVTALGGSVASFLRLQ